MHFYRFAGFLVRSDTELPLTVAPAEMVRDGNRADIEIRHEALPHALDNRTQGGAAWDMTPEAVLLRGDADLPLRLRVRAGREVSLDAPAITPHTRLLLTGAGLGIALQQRGMLVLHGAAVAIGGRAVAFIGDSGAGKSTLAAALGRDGGAPLLAEDIIGVDFDGAGRPLALSDGRTLKLARSTAAALGLAITGAALGDEVYVGGERVGGPLPLAALYCVETGAAPDLRRLPAIEAIGALRHRGFRHEFIGLLGREAEHFRQAARVAAATRICRLTRPDDLDRLPQIVDMLRRHWRREGWL